MIGNGSKIAQEVFEIEKHLHNYEKWFGAAGVPSGEAHIADRVGLNASTFQLVSGNNAFGSWVQILGSDDTPVGSGKTKYDAHRIIVINSNSTLPFGIQIISGESSNIVTKLAAEEVTEFIYVAATNNNDAGIQAVIDRRSNAQEKLWARCICIGGNGPLLNFYFGIHEYDR